MCSSRSFGLGSNVSMWLGPPSINRKMQAFALAAWCGCLGDKIPAWSADSATLPSPQEVWKMKSRRDGLVNISELVSIQQNQRAVCKRPNVRQYVGRMQVLF